MRTKMLKTVWAFETTTEALKTEDICRAKGLPGRLIPTPGVIRVGCGLAWCALPSQKEAIDSALRDGGVHTQDCRELWL